MKPHNAAFLLHDSMYTVCEFGGHLDLEYKYIYANGLLLARYDKSSPDTHCYHHDGLGSIVGLTAENTFVEQSYFYDEFGNELGSWGSVSNNYLYTGQEYDGSITGLYNLRARLYDMRIGRFTVEDPVLQNNLAFSAYRNYFFMIQDLNPYSYCADNPTNMIDPSGLRKYYGNWCGDAWTGGKRKYFEDMTSQEMKDLNEPIDPMDWCCMSHDYCFWRCRKLHDLGLNDFFYWQCLTGCDNMLFVCLSGAPAYTPLGMTMRPFMMIPFAFAHHGLWTD